MARVLNNEVSILNIASLDNDIKDSFTRAMVSENENTTSVASKAYSEGEYFIHNDRYLYKALTAIAIGETITPGVNAEVVTVSEELVKLFAQSPEGIFEVLSNVESTSTASKNYVKGEQIIWTDKELYTVTTDVTTGTTWAVGTNLSASGNITSQIKILEDTDETMLNVLGAKNLLQNIAKSQVANYVTYTVNTDGTVTCTGTATDGFSGITIADRQIFKKGKYILSGCPSGGEDKWSLFANVSGVGTVASDNGEGAVFELESDSYVTVGIAIAEGQTVNFVYKPMIRPASIKDSTYVPYAMTNRELTEKTKDSGWKSFQVASYGGLIIYYRNVGGVVNVCIENQELTGLTPNIDNEIAIIPDTTIFPRVAYLARTYDDDGFWYVTRLGTASLRIVLRPSRTSGYYCLNATYLNFLI